MEDCYLYGESYAYVDDNVVVIKSYQTLSDINIVDQYSNDSSYYISKELNELLEGQEYVMIDHQSYEIGVIATRQKYLFEANTPYAIYIPIEEYGEATTWRLIIR